MYTVHVSEKNEKKNPCIDNLHYIIEDTQKRNLYIYMPVILSGPHLSKGFTTIFQSLCLFETLGIHLRDCPQLMLTI